MQRHIREAFARYAADLLAKLQRKENAEPPEPGFGESSDYKRAYIPIWPGRKPRHP